MIKGPVERTVISACVIVGTNMKGKHVIVSTNIKFYTQKRPASNFFRNLGVGLFDLLTVSFQGQKNLTLNSHYNANILGEI